MRPTRFGEIGVVWQDAHAGPKVYKVILPHHGSKTTDLILATFQDAIAGTCPTISELCDKMQAFLDGNPVGFELGIIARGLCSRFQKRVLFAEYKIPRGWISTYGRIASYIRNPKSVRAVGNALANNPFPIIIPCHRAVQSTMNIGGYQGGSDMKCALLEMEGVEISKSGKVITDRIYY